jgi:hypothetical protein
MRHLSHPATLLAVALSSVVWAGACIPSVDGAGAAAGSSGGASSGSSGSSGTSGGNDCVGTSHTGQKQGLGIYIMLDRSFSMDDAAGGSTKWDAVSSALSSFVGQAMADTSVGLQYFPLGEGSQWSGDANSCSAADYASPEVEIGALTQTASRIRASIASQERMSGTPTSAALQGAVDHARSWGASHGGYAPVVILATDGEPTTCDQNLSRIYAIAAAGVSATPSVRTFVIGVGRSLSNLDGIASAGGTTSAFIVDTSGSVSTQFLDALNAIRGKAVGCSYAIPAPPPGQIIDPGQVNVAYTPGGGSSAQSLQKVASAAACGTSARAWHYDNETSPSAIVLCPTTCSNVGADAAATVKIVLGCTTNGEF